jgi:hypothetical protein
LYDAVEFGIDTSPHDILSLMTGVFISPTVICSDFATSVPFLLKLIGGSQIVCILS